MPPGRTTAYEKLLVYSPKGWVFAELSGHLVISPPVPERLAAQVNLPLRPSAPVCLVLRYTYQCMTLPASSTGSLTRARLTATSRRRWPSLSPGEIKGLELARS
jgi:hypothetical protein